LLFLTSSLLATGISLDTFSSERAAAQRASEAPAAVMASFRHDAALADVCFINRSLGWAVGDRGVIWHTQDGGANWREQSSGVACRLSSVFFLNPRLGWAVGGESRPLGCAARGVVLRTEDGGARWASLTASSLPHLTHVKFFDAARGIVLGHSTAAFPMGGFITQNGGESWQPIPADRAGSWLAGDFLDSETGAVAGAGGEFAALARRQLVHSSLAVPSLRSFHAMQLVAPTGGWLAGDGGIVMTTRDLGHSWQSPPAELPPAAEHFDFHALAIHGEQVWVAGAPGTRVFHSPDAGQTWHAAATGQNAPLRALSFVDGENGWTVGELGAILVTRDAGRSWQVQRSGAQRAGLLAIFATAEDVPLELTAHIGAAERYITAVDILHIPAMASGDQAARERAREAMLLAGAAAADSAWRFPAPPEDLALGPDELLAALNRANDGRALDQLEKHLVGRLRMWRPDVVVTHHPTAAAKEPAAALIAELLLRAVDAAADPERYAELASDAGLAAWQVKKVYGVLPQGSRGGESVAPGCFAPLLGATFSDFVAPARHLLAATSSATPDTIELELLLSRAAEPNGQHGLFSGVPLAAEAECRRPPAIVPAIDSDEVRRAAARRHRLEKLLDRSAGNAAWAAQVGNLTEDLKPDDGAELLLQLADGYRAKGRLDLAADTYYLLARRYPDHPLVDRGLIWLVQYYASGEAGYCAAPGRPTELREKDSLTAGSSIEQTSLVEQDSPPAATAPAIGISRDDRLRRAIQLAEYMKTSRPALYAEPAVRFAEVAAQRQLGFANPARRYFLTLRRLPKEDAWRECAAAEEWLAKPQELPPPKPSATCRRIAEPPLLDGRLDDACWDAAERLQLRPVLWEGSPSPTSAPQTPPTKLIRRGGVDKSDAQNKSAPSSAELRLAYDTEFLYLAIRAPKLARIDYPLDDRPRPRDADLGAHDRVTIQLDVDRDFCTAFGFTVDARGWTHDACWGDVNWNPNWYVAAAGDETSWAIEAAVPLAELGDEPPVDRHVWALSARRIIPRVGYESWAPEAAGHDTPSQFGLLIFDEQATN
jgi:photosystem II stability/assembly factor-like uncharacterized protein